MTKPDMIRKALALANLIAASLACSELLEKIEQTPDIAEQLDFRRSAREAVDDLHTANAEFFGLAPKPDRSVPSVP